MSLDHAAPPGQRSAVARARLGALDRLDQEPALALEVLRRPRDVGDVDAGGARRRAALEPAHELVLPARLRRRARRARDLAQELAGDLARHQQLGAGAETTVG